jgi:NAD(P)-dependent dehydrogenase (short-subunit alcohol dehydrogenase family)
MKEVRKDNRKVVFISSITSDIGIALAKRYSQDGYVVAGTYRSKELLPELANLPFSHLYYCDLEDKETINHVVSEFSQEGLVWDTFISCASIPNPLTKFFESNFDEWSYSIHINAIEQLRVLHAIYPFRSIGRVSNIIFFAGPGTNSSVKNFSSLTVSKIMLIKMCELLDAEYEDINVFIVGPGWTKTKAHERILSDPHVSPEKYKETLEFMKNKQGTSMDDIYECIRWLNDKGRNIAGGRNFSVVYDCWGTNELAGALLTNPDMYKLRRCHNDWKNKERDKNK